MCDGAVGLAGLEARLAEDLASIQYPGVDWVPPSFGADGTRALDVAIIGAGMLGLCAAFALMREGIVNVLCLDAAPEGSEGPWVTWARMQTLRSPKHLQGPALGIASLSFRAWFIAQWGRDAWERLDKAPRIMWMDYLRWFRHATRVPVRNRSRVVAVVPDGDLYRLDLQNGQALHARHVVLATGRDGVGGPHVPPEFRGLPPSHCAHSSDAIDFAALVGRRIAVVGANASAFDNAAVALEVGCAEMTLLVRRPALPRVNKFMQQVNPGFTHGAHDAPAEARLRMLQYAFREQVPPPRESVLRVSRHRNAHMLLGCPVFTASIHDGRVRLVTARGTIDADFVILGTGFANDVTSRGELSAVAPDIALFSDHVAGAGIFAASPWLGDAYEFTAKPGRTATHLARLHCFNFAATASCGRPIGDIPALSENAQRLSRGIAARLFNADLAQHQALLQAYATPELIGDEWPDLLPTTAE